MGHKLKIDNKKIINSLKLSNGNKTKAAKLLGIPKSTWNDKYNSIINKSNKSNKNIYNVDKYKAVIIETALSKTQGNKTKAAKLLGMPRSTFNDKLNKVEDKIQGFYKNIKKKKIYVITSAQNETPTFKPGLESLKQYCKHKDSELIVVPFRYKNPTNIFSIDNINDEVNENNINDWWDEDVLPYLCDSRIELNENLILFADIKIRPTATNPLSGFNSLGGNKSVILGHTKLSLKTIPVTSGSKPKILTTTGCITVPNYTESKEGKKGDFHHSYSAIVVEIDDNIFYIRQLNITNDGSFIDLDYEYTPTGVKKAPPALAIVMGDTHVQHVDPDVLYATFEDKESIYNLLQPKYLVWHDLLDFNSKNHHHKNEPFINYMKHLSQINNVKNEVYNAFELVNKYSKNSINIFPFSNHPEALTRWIKETDWKIDPTNAEFYLETALVMLKNTKLRKGGTETLDPFTYWGKKILNKPENSIFLSKTQPFLIDDIDVSNHGHLGSNGSKGSIKVYSSLGRKTIIGHGHGPGIEGGSYQVGTSSYYELDYVGGPSSWLHTHCVIYANGKRSLIIIIGNKFKI